MSPIRQAGKPILIVQISDFHLLTDFRQTMMGINTEESFLAVLEVARQAYQDIALFLMTGDLAQEPTIATYQRLRGHLGALPVPCCCLPGNHDDPELIRRALVGDNIVFQTQVLLDGWQLVCLDSTVPQEPGGYLAPEQLALLEAKLVEQPARYTLVCLHHSPLPTGSPWLDTMKLANAKDLFALLERFPQVKGVVYGHIHQAMDVKRRGVRFLGGPSTCFQFKQNSEKFALDFAPHGYRWIELYAGGEIRTGVVRMNSVPRGLDLNAGGY